MDRKLTRKVKVGKVYVGGDAPVTIQSMTNTDTRDAKATIYKIKRLEEVGFDVVIVPLPDM